jgi:hypothetical protein
MFIIQLNQYAPCTDEEDDVPLSTFTHNRRRDNNGTSTCNVNDGHWLLLNIFYCLF